MSVRITHPGIARGGRTVLHPALLVLPEGATVAVVGANGAGKTTLFLALAGLLRGRGPHVRMEPSFATISFMAQAHDLPAWLTTRQAAPLYGVDGHRLHAAAAALDMAPLLDRPVHSLSGGERQAMRLILAIARPAELLLLDEPFAHLDFRSRLRAIAWLQPAPESRRLTLISSQSAADLVTCCNACIVLRDGDCVFCGPVADLIGSGPAGESRLRRLETRVLELLEPGTPAPAPLLP